MNTRTRTDLREDTVTEIKTNDATEAEHLLRGLTHGDRPLYAALRTLLAEYARRGARIVDLEAGREVEQHMVRYAAVQLEEVKRQREAALSLLDRKAADIFTLSRLLRGMARRLAKHRVAFHVIRRHGIRQAQIVQEETAVLREQRAAALDLHPRAENNELAVCRHCSLAAVRDGVPVQLIQVAWPCPTVQALGGAS